MIRGEKTSTKREIEIMVSALRILASDIKSEDGVANSCIAQAAGMIEELSNPENLPFDVTIGSEQFSRGVSMKTFQAGLDRHNERYKALIRKSLLRQDSKKINEEGEW